MTTDDDDPLLKLPDHPSGGEQYVIRWNPSTHTWQKWFFTTGHIEQFKQAPADIFVLPVWTKDERKRLRVYRQAAIDGYFNEWAGLSPEPGAAPADEPLDSKVDPENFPSDEPA